MNFKMFFIVFIILMIFPIVETGLLAHFACLTVCYARAAAGEPFLDSFACNLACIVALAAPGP